MLKVQAQPQLKAQNNIKFTSRDAEYRPSHSDDCEYDEFDKEAIEEERDEKVEQINEQKRQFDEIADELENSDSKITKKAGKLVRFGSAVMGLAATFVLAKYSSKLSIEGLKTIGKTKAAQGVIETAKKLKDPASKAYGVVKTFTKSIMEKPQVKEFLANPKVKNVVETTKKFVENPKVQKVLEPVKNTVSSIRNIKVNGKSVQSAVENTMAATTTGSVLVDNLTGRNSHKSNLDLATGV